MKSFKLPRPDDWHCHLRDNEALPLTVAHHAKQFARAIVMPNLSTPITSVEQAHAYRERIIKHIPSSIDFTPLMTLYLTDQTRAETIEAAKASDFIHAFKLYPAGATTNSSAGVQDLSQLEPVLSVLEACQMPLLIHGEVTDADIDIFDREQVFIERYLMGWIKKFPSLRIVLEHITSAYAVNFVKQASSQVAATITAHHLLLNRNDLLVGGIHPHYYCLPIVKAQADQRALIDAATSSNPKFFLGTDSAPHRQSHKESACGCAGIYTAHCALELYAQVFSTANAMDKLAGFSSEFGADFYQLPRNQTTIELIQKEQTIPESYPFMDNTLIPFMAGETLNWQIAS